MSLRTLQVVNVRWFNATAWYGFKAALLLRRAGYETRVIALPGTESFSKAVEMGLEPIPLHLNAVAPCRIAASVAGIVRQLREFRPDVVNCHRGESFLFWGLLKAWGRFALVRTRGDQRPPKNNLVNRLLHRRLADAVVATNSVTARQFSSGLGVPSERIHTVLGGVDRTLFRFDPEGRARVRRSYGLTDRHLAIGLLGRFDRVKGQRELLRAAGRLVAEGRNDIRVLLLGFPTAVLQDEVEADIRAAGLEGRAFITGLVDDVAAHISALDVGVVASLWSETIARAALEIMSCGRPLLSTSVGVMPDLLPPEALIPPGDVEALTAVLRRFADNADLRRRLAAVCSARMETLDDACFLDETLRVYKAALQQRFGNARDQDRSRI